MRIVAIMPTRDGNPPLQMAQKLDAACRYAQRLHGCEVQWRTVVAHLSVGVARNMAVAHAYKQGATHLFMVDDDTYLPEDAIARLIQCDAAVATGVTPSTLRCMGQPEIPIINVADEADENHQAQWFRNWFHGQRPVKYCGASCWLIRMDVFEKVGFPWFRMGESWVGNHYWNWSEDIEFCERLQEHEIEIIADGDCRCDHDRKVRCRHLIKEEAEAELQPA